MAGTKGYYGLIQYCPDPSRAEAANVGVVLFCPEPHFIGAQTSAGNDRIRKFFGGHSRDLKRINAAKQAIETRLKATGADFRSIDDLNQFIATRANELKITPLRSTKVQNPEADLDALFKELVGGRSSKEPEMPACPELETYFRQPSFARLIKFDQAVEIPVLGRTLRVPYAYQNGRLNLIKPQRFSDSDTAIRLAVEGDLLQRHNSDSTERRLIVVSSFSPKLDGKAVNRVKGVLGEYHIQEVVQDRIPEFVRQVENEAHLAG